MSTDRTQSIGLSASCALLALGCTLNVQTATRTVDASSRTDPATLRARLTTLSFVVDRIDVVGSARTDAHASMTVSGLFSSGQSVSDVDRGVVLAWDETSAPQVTLRVAYEGPAPESVWLDRLALEIPTACALDLEATDARVDVTDVSTVRVRTTSGAVLVSRARTVDVATEAGRVEVTADVATVRTESGDVVLHVSSAAMVSSTHGPVSGTLRGGSVETSGGGSVDLRLDEALASDLAITTLDGAVELVVAADASFDLEVRGSGPVHVDVGSVVQDASGDLDLRLGSGGFRVIVTTDDAPVRIEGA